MYIDEKSKKERKKYGQFFTSKETALFMASLFRILEDAGIIKVLDAGAGSGILSCALMEKLQESHNVKRVELTCYENDENILEILRSNLLDPIRIKEINDMTKHVTAGKIFVTAFQNFTTFKKFSESLAWETEVWISDMPEHMIHLNGDRFMGPKVEVFIKTRGIRGCMKTYEV